MSSASADAGSDGDAFPALIEERQSLESPAPGSAFRGSLSSFFPTRHFIHNPQTHQEESPVMHAQYQISPERRALYRKEGFWGDASLADWWRHAVLACPDRRAVRDNHGAAYTYRELDDQASRLAACWVLHSCDALQAAEYVRKTSAQAGCRAGTRREVPLLPQSFPRVPIFRFPAHPR